MSKSSDLQPAFDAERLLSGLSRVVPGLLYVFNQATQSNEYASSTVAELLGYTAEQVQAMGGDFLPSITHPDDFASIGAHFEKIRALDDGDVAVLEYRVRRPSGEWVWLQSYDSVFERDEAGQVLRHLGVATDITKLKAAEQTAVQGRKRAEVAAERLRAVLDTVDSAIIGLDASKRVITLNPVARHLLGTHNTQPPFDWPTQIQFLQRDGLRELEASADPINRALAGQPISAEAHLVTRTGSKVEPRYVRVSSALVSTSDSGVKTVVAMTDITEQERNRQQAERSGRLDALGQLTGGIAHDFNNLLATVLYAVELIGNQDVPDDAHSLLDTVRASLMRGRELTRRLLSFAKAGPGDAMARTVTDIYDDFDRLARPSVEDSIELHFVEEVRGLSVYCDQAQLDNALLNLVLNARDAIVGSTKGRTVKISARPLQGVGDQTGSATGESLTFSAKSMRKELRAAADEGAGTEPQYVELSVSDDGPGMTASVLQRAIDPFFTTKEPGRGSGLGLSTVYGFVMQAGGELRIYSEPGTGTTVNLILPRGDAAGRIANATSGLELIAEGEHILLVEDELHLALVIESILEQFGFEVTTTHDGMSALSLIESGVEVDAVLTDVVMPKLGGFELARRLRQGEGRSDLPIVFMSGYTGFSDEQIGEFENARVLQKPCPPKELAVALRAVLDSRR